VASDPSDLGRILLAAGGFFATRGVYGLAWIDAGLVVRGRYGSKADFIALDRPITDSVFPFIGSEEFIAGLQRDPSQSLELPGVVIVTGADTQDRYNLSLFWSAEQHCYFLLIARASLDATLEIELLRHVRARLMAEAETKTKADELARANRDLEDFAAIVSHDLKAPMRALHFMTDEVEAALDGARYTEAMTQIEWIRTQSRRMSSMLTVLLDYSTIGRKSRAIELTDTGELAHAVAGSLKGRGFKIDIEGVWPVIDTLKAPLDLVIRNLIDNAIKHHDGVQGHVRVTCQPTDQSLVIEVADDGPGVPPEHAQAIFLPFRTLSNGERDTAAGIGMGLSLVLRTTEGVGGVVRLKPSAGGQRGAVFEVVWPKTIVAQPDTLKPGAPNAPDSIGRSAEKA
jgi:signal transduction histidine kinase